MTRRLILMRGGKAAGALLLIARSGSVNPLFGQNAVFALAQIDDDPVLKAMRDEMERSRQLGMSAAGDPPYFFSYDFTDSEDFHMIAELGSAVTTTRQHGRTPGVEVRVGSYDFDNTGHVFSGRYTGSRYDGNWPLDDNYGALRNGFWLLTDRTFKTAVESMGRKRASLKNMAAQTEHIADFSKADAVVSLPKAAHRKIDEAGLTQRFAKLSGVFSAYPEVLSSSVEFQVIDGITYLLNSEGTAIRYRDNITSMLARAEGQAEDGMIVRDAVSVQSLDLDKFPSDAEVRPKVVEIGEHVRALLKAPTGEAYTGPILFEPTAAAQMLAQLLGDNLHVPRKPLSDPGRPVNGIPSEFETRVGARVLPEWLNVTDDPTQSTWNGKALAGYYQFDLEGVPAKPVALIEKGILKNFLMTRQPVKGFAASNGHARLLGSYGANTAAMGNMFVTASESMALADLKKRAIQMAMDRGKQYAMLVRKLAYPFSGPVSELQSLAQASQQSGGSTRPLSPPLMIYRIYADGREELVRGLRFRGVSTRSLRDIEAASQETALFDFVNNSAPLALLGQGGYIAATAVIAPGLLFEEMELESPQEQLQKRAIVPAPSLA